MFVSTVPCLLGLRKALLETSQNHSFLSFALSRPLLPFSNSAVVVVASSSSSSPPAPRSKASPPNLERIHFLSRIAREVESSARSEASETHPLREDVDDWKSLLPPVRYELPSKCRWCLKRKLARTNCEISVKERENTRETVNTKTHSNEKNAPAFDFTERSSKNESRTRL